MRKVLVVTAIVTFCFGSLSLAATKGLTNNTGGIVTGIVIRFSEEVSITSWDKTIFPTREPASGRALEFVFAGGTLAAGGRFSISWTPGTAALQTENWRTDSAASLSAPPAVAERFRGVNGYIELLNREDIRTLALDWKANLLRLCLGTQGERGTFGSLFTDPTASPILLPQDLRRLDEVLDRCEEVGMRVIIDLHQCPGYQDNTLWQSPSLQQRLIQFWQELAAHCAGRGSGLYGYGLLNEPHDDGGRWNKLAQQITDAIRRQDPTHAIVIDCPNWANPDGFSSLKPVNDRNVVYSFHMWKPHDFTHQGVGTRPVGKAYPTEAWNASSMRRDIEPVLAFQTKYKVPILVGEFGASYSASSASRAAYLADCMSLFEEFGFDYCYWCFREWPLWSLEHEEYQASWGKIGRYVGTTESLEAVLRFFGLNRAGGETQKPPMSVPACLFDESHWQEGQDAALTNADLAWRLLGFCSVRRMTSGPINGEALKDVGLLVLGGVTKPLAESEAQAVFDFVEAGGRVLVYGDVGASLSVNLLLVRLGIVFDNRVVLSRRADWDLASFWVPYTPTADIIAWGGSFHTNWGGSLSVSPPATAVLLTDENTWRDANGNSMMDPTELGGPLVLAAVSQQGAGRVAVVADNSFGLVGPWGFFSQLVRWLIAEPAGSGQPQETTSTTSGDALALPSTTTSAAGSGEPQETTSTTSGGALGLPPTATSEGALGNPLFVVDDLKDGDFTNALSDVWRTLTQEASEAGNPWQAALPGEDAAASMQVRHVFAGITKRYGDNWIVWSTDAVGWAVLRTWLAPPQDFDASPYKGVYLILESERDLDLTVGIDYRQAGAGSWENWELRSASCPVHLAGRQVKTIALPFSDFNLDDATWVVQGGDSLGDVERTHLESVALIAATGGVSATVYLREVGFYGLRE